MRSIKYTITSTDITPKIEKYGGVFESCTVVADEILGIGIIPGAVGDDGDVAEMKSRVDGLIMRDIFKRNGADSVGLAE